MIYAISGFIVATVLTISLTIINPFGIDKDAVVPMDYATEQSPPIDTSPVVKQPPIIGWVPPPQNEGE